MTTTEQDNPPPAKSYRIRMRRNKWFVSLYADMTVGDYLGDIGPFATIDDATTAGENTGLSDADKIDTPTGRGLAR